MTESACTTVIQAPADAVWRVISDFGAAGQYLPGVAACEVEGEGLGALRRLTSTDGSQIVERLEALDPTARRISYALLTDTPFRGCLTTLMVCAVSARESELTWSAVFEAEGLPESEAQAMLAAALSASCAALKQYMEG